MLAEYSDRRSGWVLSEIICISVICSQHTSLCRLSGRSYIPTPEMIANKKYVIYITNQDRECFLYAILAILKRETFRHDRRRNDHTKYIPFLHELKFTEAEMPMKISNIGKFERSNPHLAINVIKYTPLTHDLDRSDDDEDYLKHPCFDLVYRSRRLVNPNLSDGNITNINLLLVAEKDNYHYLAITQLDRLLNCNPDING